MFHVKRGAATLVHEDNAATPGHVTEGVSRETEPPHIALAASAPDGRPGVSRETD